LQCSRLRFPEEVKRTLQLQGPSDDRSSRGEETEGLAEGRGTIVHLEGPSPGEEGMTGELIVTAGLPWWRSPVP
jgi:hypothetical protein